MLLGTGSQRDQTLPTESFAPAVCPDCGVVLSQDRTALVTNGHGVLHERCIHCGCTWNWETFAVVQRGDRRKRQDAAL